MLAEKKKKIFVATLVFIIVALIVLFVVLANNKKGSENKVSISYSFNVLGEEVSNELKDVYLINYFIDDEGLKINGINKQNKIINIVNMKNDEYISYEDIYTVSYDDGKLYYSVTTEEGDYNHDYIYYVDLTKKDYPITSVISDGVMESNDEDIEASIYYFYVNNGILYYEDDDVANINSLDLESGKTKEIVSDENISLIGINKKNNKLLYHVYDGKIMEYDMQSKKTKKVVDGTLNGIYKDKIIYENDDELYSYDINKDSKKKLGNKYTNCIPLDNDYICEDKGYNLYLYNSNEKIFSGKSQSFLKINNLLENNLISVQVPGELKVLNLNSKKIEDADIIKEDVGQLYYIN